tara:strand:- start:79 stop:969 length:891 start_codon:yes stop_codon:yes gene_type:complete
MAQWNYGQGNYYDGAQEYNPNYGKNFAGVGRFDPRNMMRPDNLTQDLGAATYQAPQVYPGQRNIHEGFGTANVSTSFPSPEKKGILQTMGNWGKRFMDNTMVGRIAAGFNPTNPNAFNFSPMLQGQLDLAMADEDEGGLGWGVDDIGRFTSGPLAGQASMSGFGTNDVTQQLRNRLQKLRSYTYQSKIKAKKEKDIQDAIDAQVAAENAGYSGTPGGNTGSGAFAKFDNTTKDYGPHSKGGSNQSGGSFSGAGAGTGAQGPAGGAAYGGGRRDGPSGRKAYGGRVPFFYGGLAGIL